MNFLRYIVELMTLLQQCERLSDAIHHAKSAPIQAEDHAAKGYVFHRDALSAARTALGAFVIILGGCLLWIYSAWPDGGTAVSILGVCCTLFGSFDTPAPHIVKYIIGSVWGVLISLIYSFALLPRSAISRCWWRRLPRSICLPGHCRRGRPRLLWRWGLP